MPKMRHVLFLACAVSAVGLCLAGSASAAAKFRGAPSMRGLGGLGGLGGAGPAHNFSGMRHGFNRLPGLGSGSPLSHGGSHGGAGRLGHGARGPQQHNAQDGSQHGPAGGQPHGNQMPAANNASGRNGLPHRPFPGEAGFTGVPPQGETRFVSHEMVVHLGADASPQMLDAAARRLGLTPIGSQNLSLSGGRLFHFRTTGDVSDAIRSLETENIIAQPNYVYDLQQDARSSAALPPKGDPNQYVPDKLHLREAHAIASGANVTVAVIDSLIDTSHPDLVGSVVGQFDAVAATDTPDEHGTGMTGAIAGHRRLLGVAPRARILAIHAFTPNAKHPQQATTQSIVAGIDWAVAQGAKVINMSFAGPYDPMLQIALKRAHDKFKVVLVAAAGNMGPQSPPLYPAADENVIAVTAVDEKDALLPQANQGPHVALAAPGVNVWEATPHANYNFTTGTSVAAAHVSGVAALILERNPNIDPAALEDALYTTAQDLGPAGRDPQFGWGLVDPYRALMVLESKPVVQNRRAPETTASAITSAAGVPNPASPNRSLPKPPPGAAELVSGVPAGPIGPATPRVSAATPAGDTAGRAPPALATPAAIPPDPAGGEDAALIEKKREACRQAGADQGVEATEIADYVAACVSEARLACFKQAVAQKVHGPERRDFINRCLQGS